MEKRIIKYKIVSTFANICLNLKFKYKISNFFYLIEKFKKDIFIYKSISEGTFCHIW